MSACDYAGGVIHARDYALAASQPRPRHHAASVRTPLARMLPRGIGGRSQSDVRYAPNSDRILRRSEMTLSANRDIQPIIIYEKNGSNGHNRRGFWSRR